jgi:hypothetical protein
MNVHLINYLEVRNEIYKPDKLYNVGKWVKPAISERLPHNQSVVGRSPPSFSDW